MKLKINKKKISILLLPIVLLTYHTLNNKNNNINIDTEKNINYIIENVKNDKKNNDYLYKLYLKDNNHSVRVYDKMDQKTVDNINSAGSFIPYNTTIIGDHNYQGFEKIKSLIINESLIYTCDGNIITEYICINKFIGKNKTNDLVDQNGITVLNKNEGGIILYTCNNDDTVTIVYLKPTGNSFSNKKIK